MKTIKSQDIQTGMKLRLPYFGGLRASTVKNVFRNKDSITIQYTTYNDPSLYMCIMKIGSEYPVVKNKE